MCFMAAWSSFEIWSVAYEAQGVLSLKTAFDESVDDYLQSCRGQGRSPDTPLKGSFNVRSGRE